MTEMLDEDMDVNSKASTAMVLLSYANLACDLARARRAVVCIDPLLAAPRADAHQPHLVPYPVGLFL